MFMAYAYDIPIQKKRTNKEKKTIFLIKLSNELYVYVPYVFNDE